MNIEDARGTLEEFLKDHAEIDLPGRLISHLEQAMGGRMSSALIAAALEDLAVRGKVVLRKQNGTYDGVGYIGEEPAEGETSPAKAVAVSAPNSEGGRIANLNAAFAILKSAADSAGKVDAPSCMQLIREKMGCSKDQASNLNMTLGQLKLRTSVNRGGGAFDHYVDLSVTSVTAVMLERAKPVAALRPLEKMPAGRVTDTLEPEKTSEEPTATEVAEHLAGIVAKLEDDIKDLRTRNSALEAENTGLRAQLEERQISTRVKQVLKRFPLS